MKTINKPSDNLGGLIKIWAVPSKDFLKDSNNIDILDTTNVYEIYCSPDSMQFQEPRIKDSSGIHYKPSITGFVPKDTEDTLADISYIEQRLWVIVFMDGNGKYKVSGTQHLPLRISFTLNTKNKTSQRAGYSMQVYGTSLTRAPFLDYPF